MPPLIAGNGNPLYILLNSACYYFKNTSVMAQVYNFYPLRLQNAPHDVNRSIMAIEQTGGSNHAHWINRHIGHTFLVE